MPQPNLQPAGLPQPPFYYALLVFGFAFVLFANTIWHEYAYDDFAVIVNNSATQQGFAGFPQIFTQKTYLPNREVYRPLTQATFAAEAALFGNNPMPPHLANVLLYALTCVGIFYFIYLLFGKAGIWLPMGAALLFAALPVHTEVVANIKSRDELLMFFWGICSLYCVAKAVQTQKLWFSVLAVLFFTAATLCKENAITLPGIALLVTYYLHNKPPMVALHSLYTKHKITFTVTALILSIMLYLAVTLQTKLLALYNIAVFMPFLALSFGVQWQGRLRQVAPLFVGLVIGLGAWGIGQWVSSAGGALPASSATTPPIANMPVEPLNNILLAAQTTAQKIATICLIAGKYLQLLAFPFTLVYHYGYAQLPIADFTHWQVWVSIALHIGLLALLFIGLTKKTAWGFGIAFYFIALSVYSHITFLLPNELSIPIGSAYRLNINAAMFQTLPDTMAERFLLMPSLGFCLAVVFLLGYLTRLHPSPKQPDPLLQQTFTGALALLLLLYGGKTVLRNMVWKNNQTLFTSDLENMPNNAMAHTFYAKLWLNRLAGATNNLQAQEFAQQYEKAQLRALQIYPIFLAALLDLGNFYFQTNQPDKAFDTFNTALQRFPKEPAAHFNMGSYYYQQQNYQQALPYYKEALALEPYYPEAYRFLSWCYFNLGLTQDADELLQTGAKLYPQKSNFYALNAHFYFLRQQYQNAINTAQKAAAIDPQDKQALQTLIDAYNKIGKPDSAKIYQATMQLK